MCPIYCIVVWRHVCMCWKTNKSDVSWSKFHHVPETVWRWKKWRGKYSDKKRMKFQTNTLIWRVYTCRNKYSLTSLIQPCWEWHQSGKAVWPKMRVLLQYFSKFSRVYNVSTTVFVINCLLWFERMEVKWKQKVNHFVYILSKMV